MGPQALEAHLDQAALFLRGGKDLLKLGQGRHRRFLHVDVHPGFQRCDRQRGMGLDGRGKDDDVDARLCGQQGVKIGEHGDRIGQGAGLRRDGVGHGHQFQGAGRLQPGQVGEVPLAETVHAHQPDPGDGCGCGLQRGGFRGGGMLCDHVGP
ncbi:hypothetical protein QF031_000513 [Pseudarthrobacter defluvii]|nr:hypothetical protein [Pseudarthrobacter defluvii]